MPIIFKNKKELFGAGSEVTEALREIKVRDILQDIRLQPRQSLNSETISDYAEKMQSGANFPPIIVFLVENKYYVADGFHRINAAIKANRDYLSAEVKTGTFREAVLFSVSANSTHGLNRTSEDKRKAVQTLLNDPEWKSWSNNAIAKKCLVSLDLVNRMRNEITNTLNESLSEDSIPVNQVRTYINKAGNVSRIDTTNIGKKIKSDVVKVSDSNSSEIKLNVLEKKAIEANKLIMKHQKILQDLEKEKVRYYNQISQMQGRSYLNKFVQSKIGTLIEKVKKN